MIKSIILKGPKNSGKSSTVKALCDNLKPAKVYSLDLQTKVLELSSVDKINNDTFIIEIDGKNLLIIAGAPTEQECTVTEIFNTCSELEIKLSFAIISMRQFEKKEGFKTEDETKVFSKIILTEDIKYLGETFKSTPEWKDRIEKLKKLVQINLSIA